MKQLLLMEINKINMRSGGNDVGKMECDVSQNNLEEVR